MSGIVELKAWTALDSRGRPTVAVRAEVVGGSATVLAPAGASTSRHEVVERRDGGTRWRGLGVEGAVRSIEDGINPLLVGVDACDPWAIDDILESSAPQSGWGGNVTTAVTLAVLLAEANAQGRDPWRHFAQILPESDPCLPMPMVNIVSGGAHAARAVDIQDVLVVPHGARSFAEAIEMVADIRHAAARLASETEPQLASLVADEGGVCALRQSNESALELVSTAIASVGLAASASLALDIAASQFFEDGSYHLTSEGRILSPAEFAEVLVGWGARYEVMSVEDPFAEDEWSTWIDYSPELGIRQVVGDDLISTDVERINRAALGAANAVLIKVNQAGSIGRALSAIAAAHQSGMASVVSARSGETEDSWLADLAVGSGVGQIKVGSTHRSERTAKWNRLLELEARYSSELPFAGLQGFANGFRA